MTAKYRDFFKRPVSWVKDTSAYDDKVTPDYMAEDMAYFYELYQNCFQHHVQPNLQSSGDKLNYIKDESKKRLISQDDLTAYFIKNIYQPNEIFDTPSSCELERKKHPFTFLKLLDKVSGNPVGDDFSQTNAPGTNRITFLMGDVGIGKSLLTTKLIAEREKINLSLAPNDYYTLPVYLDFEICLQSERGKFKDIDDSFITSLAENIKTLLVKREKWQSDFSPTKDIDPINNFIILNKKLLKNKIRLFIILDNTDRYHFFYSKYTFFDEYKTKQSATVQKNFMEIFNIFSRVERLGDQGLAVLFVCRRSVLRFWMNAWTPEDNQHLAITDYGVYQIVKIDELTAIKSRVQLINEAIDAIESHHRRKAEDYRDILKLMVDTLEHSLLAKNYNSLSLITHFTHHGTRSFIDFLAALTIDFRTQYDLINRLFVEQPHNLLRLYITNLHCRFSQRTNHFPNLFLVDAVIAPGHDFPDAHLPHKHTYWLKYLLLAFIEKRSQNGEVVSFNELHECFVDDCEYEKPLFRLALGSLNTVNSCRCIEIDEEEDDFIRLKPTSRGKALISKERSETLHKVAFAFEFDYLQFVIDDLQLSLPNPWKNNIYVQADIRYVMSATPAYSSALREYLQKKSKAVLYFLHTLSASSQVEMERLKNNPEILTLIPNFDDIFSSYFESLKKIFENVRNSDEILEELKKVHEQLLNSNEMIDYFKQYNDSGVFVEPA